MRPHGRIRWLVAIALSVVVLLGVAFAVLRIKLEGPALGDNIASILNKRMRGRIEIGSVDWGSSEVKKAATGGWVPIVIHDVRVWDDCALSAGTTGLSPDELDELRSGDPNEDCTPDDHPDPDPASKRKPRKLLIQTPLLTADIDLHALMFGNHDFVFRSVWVHGGEALLEQTREPYPMHAYDRTIVSIVTAFYPRMRPGFRAGIYADTPPPIFDLRDIHVENLTMTVHMTPYSPNGDNITYGATARLEGVNVDAGPNPKNDSFLYMDPTDPLIAKFYVRLGVIAKHGRLRILDDGPRSTFKMTEAFPPPSRKAKYDIELTDVHLDRLAQMPSDWARRDFVANTLELDLSAKTVPCDAWKTKDDLAKDLGIAPGDLDKGVGDRVLVKPLPDGTTRYADATKNAQIHVKGELQGYWDRPYDGLWNLGLDAQNLGPTVRSCIKSTAGGDHLNASITLTGPFVALPKVGLELHDLDVDVPLRRGEEPLRLTLSEVHGSVDLVNDQGVIEKTKALVRGGKEPGEVQLSAIFAIKPYSANASIEIVKPIDVTRFLPKAVLPAGHLISGRMRARGDVDEGFALEDFDLALGNSAADKALRVHHGRIFTKDDFDIIELENVNVDAGANHAMFTGHVNTDNGKLDVYMDGDFPDLGIWLKRFDLPNLFNSASRPGPGGGVAYFGPGGGNGGMVHITGTLTKPKVNLNTELAGVPCLDKLRLYDTHYENDVLDIGQLTSEGLGGKLTGKARIRLGAVPYIESMHLAGHDLDISKLCGLAGIAKGTVETAEIDLHGSIDKNRGWSDWMDLVGNAYVQANKVSVMKDGYSNVRVCVNGKDDARCRAPGHNYLDSDDLAQCDEAKKKGGFCAVATASRDAGGMLDATIAKIPGKKPTPAKLGGTIALADLPMSLLDRFAGKSVTGGLFSTTLHLAGTPTSPQATGAIQLLRAWAAGQFLGDPQLTVEPGSIRGMPGLRIKGTAMAGRVAITGVVGTAAPYPVELQLSGRRIEVDPFIDLRKLVGSPDPVQAWGSGTVSLKTELQPASGKAPPLDAWVELSELQGVVMHRSADGHMTPLKLSVIDESPQTRAAVSVHVVGRSIELACRDVAHPGTTKPCATKLATPAGVLVIQGHANETEIAVSADTSPDRPLELALLAPLLDTQFDEVSGYLQVHASIGGTFETPTFVTEVDIDKDKGGLKLRPSGNDVELAAESGQIRLANGSLGFNDVKLRLVDQHRRDEEGALTIHGGIGLDGLTPVSWGLIVEGSVAGKMLLVAAPGLVASASGLAQIGEDGLRLYGRGRRPLVAGTLSFDQQNSQQPHPLAVFPRGVHRELAFVRGSVDIATCAPDGHERDCPRMTGDHRAYLVYINDVDVSVDGEGRISNISGPSNGPAVTLVDGAPTQAYVTLDADNVPYQTLDRTIDLTIGAKQMLLRLDGENAPWSVQGELTVVNGNYKRNFELSDQITQLGVTAPPSKPFWEEYPTIGSARLENIRVNVNRFNINNNIAQILLAGGLEITGSPRDPRLRGQIAVDRGSFRIPGTRADFTRTTGSVDFSENDPAANPALKLQSIADYRDLSGQDHEITLKISNHLDRLEWDLTTSTGYDKSQTLSLLVLGRNPEQLRRSLGDQALGGDPTRFDPSTNPSQGFTDQIVKDLAGDWVSDLLGSSLTRLTGLDVLRIEIGIGSFDIHAEKKILDNIKLLGDREWTIRGNTLNGRVEVSTPWRIFTSDKITGQAGYLNKDFYDPAEQDITDLQFKLVYKLFIP